MIKASNDWLNSLKLKYVISRFKDNSVSQNIGPDECKLGKFSNPAVLTYVLGTENNSLIETVLGTEISWFF